MPCTRDSLLAAERSTLVDFLYLRTAGDPEGGVSKGLHALQDKYGSFPVRGVGITGSGRERLGPAADTVFEIGGQDSKYISLQGGEVADFQMNKICAAGTGSFVEEQAARMGIPIGDFGPLELRGEHPCDLGERCTVFIETAIVQAEGGGSGSAAARRADGRRALCRPRRHARAAGPAGHPDVGGADAARGADIRPPPRG